MAGLAAAGIPGAFLVDAIPIRGFARSYLCHRSLNLSSQLDTYQNGFLGLVSRRKQECGEKLCWIAVESHSMPS